MTIHWQIALPLALAILSFAAAKPTTQDTLVVSRSEDETTSTLQPSTELTTEESSAPIKMTEMDVKSTISLRYAYTAVVTHVRNPAKRAQETTFRMLLPDTAFISGFTMTIDGKAYKAYVKEKEEAKQIYSEAVSQGFGAAHIASKARDSNHFTVSVNVEPNSTVMFNLTYEELLVRRNGVYNHDINLHPGTLVPKMKVTVHIKEAAKISVLRVPEIRTGNEIDAMENDPQNANALVEKTHDDREATITFTPDVNEQTRLMQVYAEKSKESLGNSHSYYSDDDDEKKDKEGVLGQFVVQYDVDRPEGGEIMVNDGYFVHFFAPKSLPPLPKHVVFVLDTSGSMMGRKVEQLRDAMKTILDNLNKNDYFSIVEFNSYVKVLDLSKADEAQPSSWRYHYYDSPPEPKLVAPWQASRGNIANAKIIISRLEAGGGTNIASALDIAVQLIQKGINWESNTNKTETQAVSNSDDVSGNKTPKVPGDSTQLENKPEPIIIFLTDGDPTVGETDPVRINNRLSEKNYGERKASIFTLAFGNDADRKFLRKLSLRNDGFMRHIYEAADAALQLQDFYRSVSSPLLADVKFLYPKAQIKESTLTKSRFRTYYAGSEAVVAGQIEGDTAEIEPQVLGFCGVQNGVGRTRYEISPKITVVRNSKSYFPLERLWAYLTIKQLLDEKEVVEKAKAEERKKELDQKILDIALKYEMVTPLTSLVVVKPNDTRAVNAESVDDSPLSTPIYRPMFHIGHRKTASFLRPLSTTYNRQPPFMFANAHRMSALSSLPAAFSHGPLGAGGAASYRPVLSQSFAAASLPALDTVAYEDENEGDRILSEVSPLLDLSITTPVDIRVSYTSVEPSTTIDPLELYSLKEFPWTLPLLNAASDSLLLSVNGTQVNLKLAKDNVNSLASTTTECSNAPGGGAGSCMYLTRCVAARSLSAALYETTYCIYDNGYAGVCCPEHKDGVQSP